MLMNLDHFQSQSFHNLGWVFILVDGEPFHLNDPELSDPVKSVLRQRQECLVLELDSLLASIDQWDIYEEKCN